MRLPNRIAILMTKGPMLVLKIVLFARAQAKISLKMALKFLSIYPYFMLYSWEIHPTHLAPTLACALSLSLCSAYSQTRKFNYSLQPPAEHHPLLCAPPLRHQFPQLPWSAEEGDRAKQKWMRPHVRLQSSVIDGLLYFNNICLELRLPQCSLFYFKTTIYTTQIK